VWTRRTAPAPVLFKPQPREAKFLADKQEAPANAPAYEPMEMAGGRFAGRFGLLSLETTAGSEPFASFIRRR
jgi:hypothetical protein